MDLYVQDLKLRAEEAIHPFKKLCRSKNVDTLVLEGESPAAALTRFLSESGIKNLVLGSSSFGWIRRIFKSPDAPAIILKSAPDFCNIFVVSRHRLTMKLANQLVLGTSTDMQIQRVSLKAFSLRERNSISVTQAVLQSSITSDIDASTMSGGSSEAAFTLPYGSHHMESNLGQRILESQSLKNCHNDVPYSIMNSMKEVEAPGEVLRLQQELQATLVMYRKACENLVHSKKKVAVLSMECSAEAKKVKDAMEREEILKQIAVEERAKHLKAIKEVEEGRRSLAKEALDRHRAEDAASSMSSEKFKLLDSLFSDGKNCRRYSKNEIEVATDNFSNLKKIGEGGYGKVYKCHLDHTPVAIKVLREDACDKIEEFIREVEVLSQLRHPHMVLLLGGCPEYGCLVYEFMDNGSLDDILFHRDGTTPLTWFIRFKIIFEVACGLAFLHGTKPEPIVHRDLKPGNILLDRNYVSKIGDVGLAKLISDVVPDGLSEYKKTVIAGTLYYMDPEYQRTGTVRPKSDLYALGIIILQLLTARHPRGLLMDVENAVENGSFAKLLDKSIANWPLVEAEKLAKLALRCSKLRCRDRPDLDSEVLPELKELLKATPSQYLCPILQEIMVDPYISADGYNYEYRAIKAWIAKYKISPVTKIKLSHTYIIRNHTLRSDIEEWKAAAKLSIS